MSNIEVIISVHIFAVCLSMGDRGKFHGSRLAGSNTVVDAHSGAIVPLSFLIK